MPPASTPAIPPAQPRSLIALLGAMVALGPLSIDLYLPAMPGLVELFGTTLSQVQLTFSSYLAGFAFFHLLCGPLADSYGRRPVLFCGLILFIAATYACSQAQTIEQLIAARFMQGIGACVGPTLGRAITRDLFHPREAAKVLALIAMIVGLAPAIAPTLGGLLLVWFDWSAIFLTTSAIGFSLLIWIYVVLPESVPERQPFHPSTVFANYGLLLRDTLYLRVVLGSAAFYSGMLVQVASASFVFIDMRGVTPQQFGLYFILIAVGYVSGSFLTTRLSGRRSAGYTMRLGTTIGLTSMLLMWALDYYLPSALSIALPMAIYSAGLGLVLPHTTICALRPFPHIAATAAALFGFAQMGMGSAVTGFVGRLLVDSPLPLIIVNAVLASICALMVFSLKPEYTDPPE